MCRATASNSQMSELQQKDNSFLRQLVTHSLIYQTQNPCCGEIRPPIYVLIYSTFSIGKPYTEYKC